MRRSSEAIEESEDLEQVDRSIIRPSNLSTGKNTAENLAGLMRSKSLDVWDGIDQNLISRMQQWLVSVSMYSPMVSHATRQGIYHHWLRWTTRSLCSVQSRKAYDLPFAVIGTIAYCSPHLS